MTEPSGESLLDRRCRLDREQFEGRPEWAVVLDEVMHFLRITEDDLGRRLGLGRVAINKRRRGEAENMGVAELLRMADTIGLPVDLFLLGPRSAIDWIIDRRPAYATNPPGDAA
jgi:transcriptional regulator with XRE-family HTH domain